MGSHGRRSGLAALAQLVEHIIRNDGVAGSNPACGTSLFNDLRQMVKVENPKRSQIGHSQGDFSKTDTLSFDPR